MEYDEKRLAMGHNSRILGLSQPAKVPIRLTRRTHLLAGSFIDLWFGIVSAIFDTLRIIGGFIALCSCPPEFSRKLSGVLERPGIETEQKMPD